MFLIFLSKDDYIQRTRYGKINEIYTIHENKSGGHRFQLKMHSKACFGNIHYFKYYTLLKANKGNLSGITILSFTRIRNIYDKTVVILIGNVYRLAHVTEQTINQNHMRYESVV